MTPTIRRAAMVATIALSAATSAWLWPDPSAPNLAYRPDMADSPALRTHEPFANSLAGTVDRTRPPGVVPRDGPAPIRYAATEAAAMRAGREMALPAALAAGGTPARAATLFEDFCQPCHGREGHGDGLTIKRGFQPPPSLLTQRARDLEDGRMFHILTFGQKLMPAQATQLATGDRWLVIRHVRDLQRRLPVDPPPFGSGPAPAARSR